MEKSALVLRHVHFEDLGSFEGPLTASGYKISYSDVADTDFCTGEPLEPDLLIVLGGPIGVYEDFAYPFITVEREYIKTRVLADRPTLGICFGAQIITSALGGNVFPSGVKEIGFTELRLTDAGRISPLRHLDGISVLHWHGDTYSLPSGGINLASTSLVEQQAFAIGSNILGLQFHPEVETGGKFERWLVGHAAELSAAGIDVVSLRGYGYRQAEILRNASAAMLAQWISELEVS